MRYLLSLVVVMAAFPWSAHGGVFVGTVDCSNPEPENFCVQGRTVDGTDIVTPFGITHLQGFTGNGGAFVINVCVASGAANSRLIGPTQRAIATWNLLEAQTGQCPAPCLVIEESAMAPPRWVTVPCRKHAPSRVGTLCDGSWASGSTVGSSGWP